VQGSVGFGLALVVVPVLTPVRPKALPATVLLIVTPLGAFMAFKERRDRRLWLAYVISGRLLDGRRRGAPLDSAGPVPLGVVRGTGRPGRVDERG
jgi:hypothetical protein